MIINYFGLLLLFATCYGFEGLPQTENASGVRSKANSSVSRRSYVEKSRERIIFVISKQTGLWRIDLNVTEEGDYEANKVTTCGGRAIAMDFDYELQTIFWSTWDGKIYKTYFAASEKDKAELLYQNDDWYPRDIAVDFVSDLIYVIEGKTNTLHVLHTYNEYHSLNSTNLLRSFSPLVADEYKPRFIELDPFKGYVFLMDDVNDFDHIYRMNSLGTDIKRLHPQTFGLKPRMGTIAVDLVQEKILLSSPFESTIYAMDYDGKQMQKVTNYTTSLYAYSLSVTADGFYGIKVQDYKTYPNDPKSTEILRSTLFFCNYNDLSSCKEYKAFDRPWIGTMIQVKALEPYNLRDREFDRICTDATCEHLCVHTGKNSYGCRCKIGWRLLKDGKKCKKIDEFLLLENDGYIGGLDLEDQDGYKLNRTDYSEVFMPFRRQLRRAGGIYGFEYDARRRNLFYTGLHSINKFCFEDRKEFSLSIRNKLSRNYGLLALDWITEKLYYVEYERDLERNTDLYSINVVQVPKNSLDNDVYGAPTMMIRKDVGKVTSMQIEPRRGFVFYTGFNSETQEFELIRIYENGKCSLPLSCLGEVIFMTIDYAAEKLYFIDANNTLRRCEYDGSNDELIAPLPKDKNGSPILSFVNGLIVHGDWIYVKDVHEIRRRNKTDKTADWEIFTPYPFNYDMRTQMRVNWSINDSAISGPCSSENGGCDQLCFAVPKEKCEDIVQVECACGDGFQLLPNGKSCAPI